VITKGERAELRSLIRARFKVLRDDVLVRESELKVELQEHIRQQFAAADKAWADLAVVVHEAVGEANRRVNDAVRGLVGRDAWPHDRMLIHPYDIGQIRGSAGQHTGAARLELWNNGTAKITATVKAAQLELNRKEVELLTRLAAGVLESEEARAFLAEIPTVSSLVPATRLLELERSLDEPGGGTS